MTAYSIWPYFLCMAVLLWLASLPAFKAADTPPNPKGERVSTLDGLRGLLALAVFFHHSAIYHTFLMDGAWADPPSRFYRMLGPCGVSLFFMITGYLFWSRMLKAAGKPNWIQLYVGRLFRIGPLYLFAAAVLVTIVFCKTGPHINVPPLQLAKDLLKWSTLGLSTPHLNGFAPTSTIIAGVTWTLEYEWRFYASLVITAFLARNAGMGLGFCLTGFVACLAWIGFRPETLSPVAVLNLVCAAFFFSGMICASLGQKGKLIKLPDTLASVLIIVLLGVLLTAFEFPYGVGPVVVSAAVFYFIISGCTVFGLLTSRPARRLGDISYGIYLLQGLVLYIVFSIPQARALALGSPEMHWALMLFCSVLLIVIATITHVYIERTGIDLGKRVAGMLGKRTAPAVATGV